MSHTNKLLSKKPGWQTLLLLPILGQCLLLLLLNYAHARQFLDYDSSLALRHGMEMWEHKTPFLQNFRGTSSLEVDCAGFWAAPLYLLTGNLSLSMMLAQIPVLLLLLYLSSNILRQLGCNPVTRRLLLTTLLTPFTVGQLEYSNMLFIGVGQYAFRILVLLFLFLFLLRDPKTVSRPRLLGELLVYAFLLGSCAVSCGSYMLLMILAPFLLYALYSRLVAKKLSLLRFDLLFLAGSILLVLACLWLRGLAPYMHADTVRTLCFGKNFIDNALGCFTGIFLILGGIPLIQGVSVFTLEGIAFICKFLLISAGFVFSLHAVRKRRDTLRKDITGMLGCLMFCHLLVLLLTDTRYGGSVFESRYHLPWLLPAMLFAFYAFDRWKPADGNAYRKLAAYLVVGALLLPSNLFGYRHLYAYDTDPQDLTEQIAALAKEQEVDTVLFYNTPNSELQHILRVEQPDLPSFCITSEKFSVDVLDFFIGAPDYTELGSRTLLLAEAKKFNDLPAYIRDVYTECGTVSALTCYRTEENPWDLSSGMPRYKADTAVDFPYTSAYAPKHGRISPQTGMLQSDGTAGVVLTGRLETPTDANHYIYTLTLHYQITEASAAEPAALTLKDANDAVLASGVCKADAETMTLDALSLIPNQKIKLELTEADGTKLEMQNITFTRTVAAN